MNRIFEICRIHRYKVCVGSTCIGASLSPFFYFPNDRWDQVASILLGMECGFCAGVLTCICPFSAVAVGGYIFTVVQVTSRGSKNQSKSN